MTENRQVGFLEQKRLAAGMSREELAFRAGVSLRAIERIEAGGVAPRRATLKVLADALGVDPTEFGVLNGEAA